MVFIAINSYIITNRRFNFGGLQRFQSKKRKQNNNKQQIMTKYSMVKQKNIEKLRVLNFNRKWLKVVISCNYYKWIIILSKPYNRFFFIFYFVRFHWYQFVVIRMVISGFNRRFRNIIPLSIGSMPVISLKVSTYC